jgi:hypothetical protein
MRLELRTTESEPELGASVEEPLRGASWLTPLIGTTVLPTCGEGRFVRGLISRLDDGDTE